MGKATIVSGGTAGFYTVNYHFDTTRLAARKAALEVERDRLNATDKPALEASILTATTNVNTASTALNTGISGFPVTVSEDAISGLQDALLLQRSKLNDFRRQLDTLLARVASITAEISRINLLPTLESRTAWCADYSESLSGDVGTIEVNGDTQNIILRPGYTVEAWDSARDGIAQRASASPSPSQTFYNWAMRPGWQKWKPRHQIATITAKTNTFGSTYVYDLTLVAAIAVDRPDGAFLPITQSPTLVNAPATYACGGTSGSAIYQVGDRVVVEFGAIGWNDPTVIGFESNPRSCYPWFVKLLDHDGSTITPSTILDVVNATSTREVNIRLFRASGASAFNGGSENGILSNATFDISTGYFNLLFTPVDPTYFLEIRGTHRVDTQYPDVQVTADMRNPVDLVEPGHYTVQFDVFASKIDDSYTPSQSACTTKTTTRTVYTSLGSYKLSWGARNDGDVRCSLGLSFSALTFTPGTVTVDIPEASYNAVFNVSISTAPAECYTIVGPTTITHTGGSVSGTAFTSTTTSTIALNYSTLNLGYLFGVSSDSDIFNVATPIQNFSFRGLTF